MDFTLATTEVVMYAGIPHIMWRELGDTTWQSMPLV